MLCQKCGETISNDAKFCSFCGEKILNTESKDSNKQYYNFESYSISSSLSKFKKINTSKSGKIKVQIKAFISKHKGWKPYVLIASITVLLSVLTFKFFTRTMEGALDNHTWYLESNDQGAYITFDDEIARVEEEYGVPGEDDYETHVEYEQDRVELKLPDFDEGDELILNFNDHSEPGRFTGYISGGDSFVMTKRSRNY